MKYFSNNNPVLTAAMNKFIKDKEIKIMNDIKKVEALKNAKAEKLDHSTARIIMS